MNHVHSIPEETFRGVYQKNRNFGNFCIESHVIHINIYLEYLILFFIL